MTYEQWRRECGAVAQRDGLTIDQLERMLRIHKDYPEPAPPEGSDLSRISEALKPLGLLAMNDGGRVVIQKVINTPANVGRTVASLLATTLDQAAVDRELIASGGVETFTRELAETDWQPDDLQYTAVNIRHCGIPKLQLKKDAASAALTLKAAILKAREFFPQ